MEYLLSDKSQARATPGSECLLTSTSLPKLLNFYLVSCKVEGKSPPTLDIYSLSISYFIQFAQANKLPLDALEVSVAIIWGLIQLSMGTMQGILSRFIR